MPRNSKRLPQQVGAPAAQYPSALTQGMASQAQPIRTPPSDAYGSTVQREATQAAAPLPDEQGQWDSRLEAMARLPFPEELRLNAPSTRPSEPLMTGASVGAGAGPEALHPLHQSPTAMVLRVLSQTISDPALADLARLAEQDGL